MPREYARRQVSTWRDEDFKTLDLAQQGFYDALCCYPKVSWCGVLDFLPKQLAECSNSLTESQVRRHVDHLVRRDFLCLDATTDELLVRTFIRHDGVLRVLNMGKSCAMAYAKVHSNYLRSVVLTELQKLRLDRPDLKGWKGIADLNPALYDEIVVGATAVAMFNPSANGSLNPSANTYANS